MTHSILDTDLYKFTTSYAYMKMFPDAECTFTYVDRNRRPRNEEFVTALKHMFADLSLVHLTEEECQWCITHIPFIPAHYWEWLKTFRYDSSKINVYLDEDQVLHMDVTDKCYKASLYEIPCLFSVPEIVNVDIPTRKTGNGLLINWEYTLNKLKEKVDLANSEGILFSEFGTRRRFSYEVQDKVCAYLKEHAKTCVGTSNVHFAMKYGMKPIGTHPHEWFMFHGAQFGYKNANYLALEDWVNVYDGDLGIALSDTYTTDVFFRNFSLKQAKLFDGVRQDSGDESEFIEKTLDFYKSKGIDPTTKTIVFSNALDFPKAVDINKFCKGKIRCSFGIGTNLTCDVYNDIYGENIRYPYENQVMKMTRCRMNKKHEWDECIKLSDDIGKHLGSNDEVNHAKHELHIKYI